MTKRAAIALLTVALLPVACGSTVTDPPSATPGGSRPTASASISARLTGAPDRPILGQTIAFTFDEVLYSSLGDGSDRTVLTDFPGPPYPYAGAFWSPSGDRLIIRVEEAPGTGKSGGYVFGVDADGSDLTNLSEVSGSHYDAMPGWSPDGSQIVYIAQKPGDALGQLYVMNADGTSPRKLIETDFEAQYPAWSSTGQIAFTGYRGGDFDIYTVQADGSRLTRVTKESTPENWPTWSPDGSRMAFFASRDGTDGIWVMGADGSNQRFLAEGGEPNWSPHGDEITFDCGDAQSAIICAVRPDGGDPIQLFGDAGFPAVRP